MKTKRGAFVLRRWLCVLLTCALLIGGTAWLVLNGSWWYPLGKAALGYREPALMTWIPSADRIERWTPEELAKQENVIFSKDLLLVNQAHPLPANYIPELVEYNGAKMHPRMVSDYISLRDDVQAQTGVRIYVASDYRTAQEQAALAASSKDGIAAKPGCSEHEAGLALDVYAPYYGGEAFLDSAAGRMVNNVCGEYGYIIRYPKWKEDLTGISYEPWHLRYVGAPHASIIMESGLTLEEYLTLLTPGTWYRTGDYLISRQGGEELTLIPGWTSCNVSPDNMGYYVVTLKMNFA